MENKREEITFFKDREGKVIGRSECGKYAIIDKNYKGEWVYPNETWEVEYVLEDETKIIIKPIQKIRTKEENKKLFDEAIAKLQEKYGFKISNRHNKRKNNV
jgi:hypothetical protein